MKCFPLTGALISALVAPVLVPALAAGSEKTSELSRVEVTTQGSALEETLPAELSAYGAELQTIDREELDKTGMSDVAQALERLTPGLHIAPKAGRGDYVNASLQGSRTRDILWLVDGVRINNRLFGGSTPLDSISSHMIERIEVLKGGQGLFYGTQAVAGVINIVLREPAEQGGGELNIAGGSLNDRRFSGHVTDGGSGGRWLLFGEHDASGGYEPYRGSAYKDNARRRERGFDRDAFGGQYHYSPGEGQSLQVLAVHNQVKADFSRPADNFRSFNDRDEFIGSLKWDHQLTERFGYYFKAYRHDWWTDYTRLGMDTGGNVSVINNLDRWGYEDYGFNLKGRYTADGGSQLLGGVDYQRYWGEDFVLRIDGRREAVTAGFLQWRPVLPFSPETGVSLGARYNSADFGGDHAIWHLGVDQPLAGDMTLKATASTNFVLPTAFQLFVVDPAFPAGNENLNPEESINSNVTLTGSTGRDIRWRLGGFYREIDELITVENGTYVNSEQGARVRGGELGLELGGSTGWQFKLDGTYARAREFGSDEQIDEIPEWFARATLAFDARDHRRGWQLAARHTGDVTTTLADFGKQQHGRYTVVDASVYQRFGEQARHRLTLRVENLTDAEYATRVSQSDDGPSGNPFAYETLGVPRNVQLEYSRKF